MRKITLALLFIVYFTPLFGITKETPDSWGTPTRTNAEFFAADDVPQSHIELTKHWYEVASNEWGNFGPLEFWIVGSDVEAAKRLDERYCNIRKQKDSLHLSIYQIRIKNKRFK